MKRKSSSILLLLLPGLLGAANLESVTGEMSDNGSTNAIFSGLKAEYDTSAKTLSIYNFVVSNPTAGAPSIYGPSIEYALTFDNVYKGSTEAVASPTPVDSSNQYFYAASSTQTANDPSSLAPLTADVHIDGKTLTLTYNDSQRRNMYIADISQRFGSVNTYSLWSFEFTFNEDIEEVIGDLALSASLSDITSNGAQLNYDLTWVGGVAPQDLGNYTVTVNGSNGFPTATASSADASGTIALTQLQYATPYTFTVSASATANGQNYPSNEVTLNLVPNIEGGLTLAITVPEENESDNDVVLNYTVTTGNISASAPIYINIVGNNGFATYSQKIDQNTGTITLQNLKSGASYQFAAQAMAQVGELNYVYSPVAVFTVNTGEEDYVNLISAEVDVDINEATITGTVEVSDDQIESVKVYYTPANAETSEEETIE